MGKRLAWLIILLGAFAASALGLSFRQVSYIPSGITWNYGYIKGGDFNHDGFQDLVFSAETQSYRVQYYGYRSFNRYIFEDSIGPFSEFWDVSDLDGDSLLDVVVQKLYSPGSGIGVFEPSDYWTFPMDSIWGWKFEWYGFGVQRMYIADLDRDSIKEILTADAQVIYLFENRGNNQYQMVFTDTVSNPPVGSFAVGEFDGDGQMEFAMGTYGGAPSMPTVFVYECTGDDQYQMVWNDTLQTANMYDAIAGPDLDGDGKIEFIIGSLRTGTTYPWKGCLWIYESTANNQYDLIFADSIPVTDRGVYCVHSACGDVDRDGRPELVWAIDRDWMVYKSPGNNQFQRVFSAYGDNGHNSTNVHIHDMNGNGYPEVIESGGNETHIWEVEAAQVVYPNGGETLYWDSSCVIRWRNVIPFQADSFSLFFSSDSGLTYSPIARGIPGSDSAYLWTVPQVTSSNCFVMLWAYQNATGWDFSDAPFTIRPATGVEVSSSVSLSPCPLVPLSVVPNPFVAYTSIPGYSAESFSLYDVSGRKVGVYKGDRIGIGLSSGIYFLKPEGKDSKPLRIIKLR